LLASYFPVLTIYYIEEGNMRMRLLGCVVGAVLASCFTSMLSGSLEISMETALAICAATGIAVGYVASTLVYVFSAKSDSIVISTPGNE